MSPVEFTTEDLSRMKCQVMDQGVNKQEFDDTEMPTDVHLVEYELNGKLYVDAVRAYTMVDIFDVYYDKIKDDGKMISITNGYGRIKPKLYGKIKN